MGISIDSGLVAIIVVNAILLAGYLVVKMVWKPTVGRRRKSPDTTSSERAEHSDQVRNGRRSPDVPEGEGKSEEKKSIEAISANAELAAKVIRRMIQEEKE